MTVWSKFNWHVACLTFERALEGPAVGTDEGCALRKGTSRLGAAIRQRSMRDQTRVVHVANTSDNRGQIKTLERVRDLAEVYTHEREVHAMLDLVPGMFPDSTDGLDIKFLEPACGSGNFLEEILNRKLATVKPAGNGATEETEHQILRALASIYGVDICEENVEEAQERVISICVAAQLSKTNNIDLTQTFRSAVQAIANTNIQRADFLLETSDTEVIDYQSSENGSFIRTWWSLAASLSSDQQQDLFAQSSEKLRSDALPVHYTDLASTPHPTTEQPAADTSSRAV